MAIAWRARLIKSTYAMFSLPLEGGADPELYRGNRRFCVHNSDCAIRSLWAGLQHIIDDVLSRVTLRKLVGTEQSMAEWIQDHSAHIEFRPELFAPRCKRRPR